MSLIKWLHYIDAVGLKYLEDKLHAHNKWKIDGVQDFLLVKSEFRLPGLYNLHKKHHNDGSHLFITTLSNTFMAMYWLVFLCCTSKTLPKVPVPSVLILLK